MSKRALQQQIHIACREQGIDADARRDLQLVVTQKASMKDMDEADLKAVLDRLKKTGFKPRRNAAKRPLAKRADIRLIHVMWKALGDAGVLNDPSRNALNKFVRSRFGNTWGAEIADVDMMNDKDQIDVVINVLSAWIERENIDFDWSRVGK